MITPSEFAQIVKGDATAELRARFLRAAEERTGDLRRMLRSAQTQANAALNRHSAPAPVLGPAAEAEDGVAGPLKLAAFSDTQGPSDQPVTRTDLIEVILGTAPAEIHVRVRNALEDPSSTLSLLIRELPKA